MNLTITPKLNNNKNQPNFKANAVLPTEIYEKSKNRGKLLIKVLTDVVVGDDKNQNTPFFQVKDGRLFADIRTKKGRGLAKSVMELIKLNGKRYLAKSKQIHIEAERVSKLPDTVVITEDFDKA